MVACEPWTGPYQRNDRRRGARPGFRGRLHPRHRVRRRESRPNGGRVATRFPPEPNGYLHIGHAKSICLNFGIASEFGGTCNLRFDDTNPTKENVEYAESIKADVRWLGFAWDGEPRYASDYFPQLYEFAVHLIRHGDAYVDSVISDEIRQLRGTLTEPGTDGRTGTGRSKESRSFRRMRAGEFEDGAHVLRARIDMASPNINMRDPILYRIRRAHHYRTGDDWSFTRCTTSRTRRPTPSS